MTGPTVEELSTVTDRPEEALALIRGEADPEEYASVQAWVRQCYNRPRDSELIMEALNEILGGFGVEAIRLEGAYVDSYHYDIVGTYVNTGDTYSGTVVLDSSSGEYLVTSWGSFYEALEVEERLEEE